MIHSAQWSPFWFWGARRLTVIVGFEIQMFKMLLKLKDIRFDETMKLKRRRVAFRGGSSALPRTKDARWEVTMMVFIKASLSLCSVSLARAVLLSVFFASCVRFVVTSSFYGTLLHQRQL